MALIDTGFNMFSDTPKGGDPDTLSKTLNLYHQKLWSKILPNGKMMCLERGTKKHKDGSPRKELTLEAKAIAKKQPKIDNRHYVFTSDALGLTFKNRRKTIAEIEGIFQNLNEGEHEKYFKKCCTIGAYTIFPGYMINSRRTINQARGCDPFIFDRIDLTLECIRLFYLNKPGLSNKICPLLDYLTLYKPFFDLFGTFKGYVEFFLFQDLAKYDFSEVRFLHPFQGFKKNDFPKNLKDYRIYMNKMLEFIDSRNKRIDKWAKENL
tara:strand:- start:289 stop:1083 length:795 start_codon:yes stop_codon:yes gene_type:complete